MRSHTFRQAQHVAAYFAQPGEISLAPLIRQTQKLGKALYVPVILPGFTLRFARVALGERLTRNRYGILEPARKDFIKIGKLDLLLCPLVSFDCKGRRVGMGGGFYDRALSKLQAGNKCAIWGVAHDLQRSDVIQAEPWDIPMHKIITERRIYTANYR